MIRLKDFSLLQMKKFSFTLVISRGRVLSINKVKMILPCIGEEILSLSRYYSICRGRTLPADKKEISFALKYPFVDAPSSDYYLFSD